MSIEKTDTFNLYIRPDPASSGSYAVSAGEPDGPTANVTFARDADFDLALKKLHSREPFRVLTTVLEQNPVAAEVGERLFNTFVKGDAKTVVSEAYDSFFDGHDEETPQRIALHLPQSLYRLPWELLRDPSHPPGWFLSLFHSLIRIDNEAKGEDPRNKRFVPTEPTLQLLFVLSNPANRPIGDFEPAETGEVKFHRVNPATYSNFQGFTSKPEIRPDGFVFLGHGDVDQLKLGNLVFVRMNGLVFKTPVSDPKPGHIIASDLIGRQRLRLGCLLACESAWVADDMPFKNSVVGSLLTGTKIPFVLGAQTPIGVISAQEFLTGLVVALQEKQALDFAITRGRKQVRQAEATAPDSHAALDWWVPVLYSKTTSFCVVGDEPAVPIPPPTRTF